MSKRFEGGCEPLIRVDVSDLIKWVNGIDRNSWPDWIKVSSRPAVVAQRDWEGLHDKTEKVVSKVLKLFPGCKDAYRSITTVHPGDYVPPHTDNRSPEWITRVHVPIVSNPFSYFITNGKQYHMDVGMSYQVNVGVPHAIMNSGKTSRIHLMFDVMQ